MLETLLIIASLLWLTLAISVGTHAKGHGRSGVFWFLVVAISGIIGIAVYLLTITSAGNLEGTRKREKNQRQNYSAEDGFDVSSKIPRRRTLVGIGGAFSILVAGAAYVETRPELKISNTTRDATEWSFDESQSPIVHVEVENPKSSPVTAEVKASIKYSTRMEGSMMNVVSKSETLDMVSSSTEEISFEFDVNYWSWRINRVDVNEK